MADNCKLCRIALENVSVVRGGQTLLQDVSMHIHCGQLTVLIGQNGAGKTTLIRALLGEYAHGGTIRHVDGEGRDVAHMRTGYVPQHLEFDKEMPVTVEDFLAARLTRRPVWTGVGKKTRAQVMEALKMVEGEKLLHRPLGRCSGGELQRVLLALALHPAPDLLVLDEPVSGVDQNGLQMFLDTVVRLKEHHHMAILLVSHDLNVVRQYADHVVLLDKTVLKQGKPDDVFASPEFQKVFGLGAKTLNAQRLHGAERWMGRKAETPEEEIARAAAVVDDDKEEGALFGLTRTLWLATSKGLFALEEGDSCAAAEVEGFNFVHGVIAGVLARLFMEGRVASPDMKALLHELSPVDSSEPELMDPLATDSTRIFDTVVAAYLLDSDRSEFDEAYLADTYLQMALPAARGAEGAGEDAPAPAARTAALTLALVAPLRDRMARETAANVFLTDEVYICSLYHSICSFDRTN